MSDIINLNRYRKRKAKVEDERRACQNRERFGRTGAQKQYEQRQQEKDRRFLDMNRREQQFPEAGSRFPEQNCGESKSERGSDRNARHSNTICNRLEQSEDR